MFPYSRTADTLKANKQLSNQYSDRLQKRRTNIQKLFHLSNTTQNVNQPQCVLRMTHSHDSDKQHAIKPGAALGYLLTSYVSTRAMKPNGNAMANEIHAANSPSDASEAGSDNSGASSLRQWVHRSTIS